MNRSEAGLAIEVPRDGFQAEPALASVRRMAADLRCQILGDGLPEIKHKGRTTPRTFPTWAFPRETSLFIFLVSNESAYRDIDPTTLPVNTMTHEELNAA
jgi:hypothetical protein